MKRYWVMKMGCFFNFATGWTVDVPHPMRLEMARIVLQENIGAVLIGEES